MLQPRFERRASSSVMTLLEQPRFRAGLDFLRLRGEVGEADPALAVWWEALFQANDDERRDLLDSVRETRGPRRVKRAAAPAGSDEAPVAVSQDSAQDDDAPPPDGSVAPRKRRRRRRKPGEPAGTPS